MSDPYLAYFDALPFVGYHYPPHLRIMDGRYKDPSSNISDSDDGYLRRIALSERRKAEAVVRQEARDIAATEAKKQSKIRQAEEKQARHLASVARLAAKKLTPVVKERHMWEGTPLPKPIPARTREDQLAKKRASAKRWREANREKAIAATNLWKSKQPEGPGTSIACTVIVHYIEGDKEFPSI